MNYYEPTAKKTPSLGFLLAIGGICLTILVAIIADRVQAKRAKAAEKESIRQTISVLEGMEKNLNRQIIKKYEEIDSLIIVRDSINHEHSTKTVIRLQQAVDSIFNRQSYIPDKNGSGQGATNAH
jgi:hypothetical protein